MGLEEVEVIPSSGRHGDYIVQRCEIVLSLSTLDAGKMCNSKCNYSRCRCDVGYGFLGRGGLVFGWKVEIATLQKIRPRRRPLSKKGGLAWVQVARGGS